jgi:hypothetical protein
MESDILRLNLANLGEAQNGKEAGPHIPRARGAQIEAKGERSQGGRCSGRCKSQRL